MLSSSCQFYGSNWAIQRKCVGLLKQYFSNIQCGAETFVNVAIWRS